MEWVIQNYDVLVKRVPELHFNRLMLVADGNDPALAKRFYGFLLDPARATPGATKQAGLVTERVAVRAELRLREQAAIDAALTGLGASQSDANP